MDKKAMLKQAAQVLREQQIEIEELQEKIAREVKAELIVKQLIDSDVLLATDVLSKLSELRSKSIGDLEIMEKAAEMYGNNIQMNFGKLSDQSEYSKYDSLTSYLVNEE